jgi:hypothetical protein
MVSLGSSDWRVVGFQCLVLTGLLGCRPATQAAPDLSGVEVTPSDTVPNVHFISWNTDRPTPGYAEFGLDDWERRTPTTAMATQHEVPLLGLKSGRTYQVRPVSIDEEGRTVRGPVQIVDVPSAPADFPRTTLVVAKPERMTAPNGYVVLNYRDGASWVVVLDMEGDPVWYMPAGDNQQVISVKPSKDGQSLLWNTHNSEDPLQLGGITRMSLDGRHITHSDILAAHHDFEELSDGRIGWLSYELGQADLGEGLDPVAGDAIWESVEGQPNPETQIFSFFDDYPYEPYSWCDHTAMGLYLNGYREWTHSNSLMHSGDEGAYYVMSKTLDALLKIDSDSGEVLWTMGGRDNEFAMNDEGTFWNHSHMSHAWPGGMAIFDNRVHAEPRVSRGVVYAYDEATRQVDEVWSYEDPGGEMTNRLGDVRKLDSGNYLMAWGGLGRLSEITEAGELVWEVDVIDEKNSGRVRLLRDLYGG